MSDVDWIFLVLTSLYLIECAIWMKPGTVAIGTVFGRLSDPRKQRQLLGNDHGCLVLSGLAPWDATFLLEPLPISVSETGTVSFVPSAPLQKTRPRMLTREYSWADLRSVVAHECEVRCGNELVALARNKRSAHHLAALLKHIAEQPESDQASLATHVIAEQFDVDIIRERLSTWGRATWRLRIAQTLLFLWLIPVAALIYYRWVPVPWELDTQFTWTFLGIGGLCWIVCVLEGFVAHRRINPNDVKGRWKLFFTSLVSPPVAMRIADRISREVLLFCHPIAFLIARENPTLLRELFPEIVRDLEYPQYPDLPAGLSSAGIEVVQSSQRWSKECVAQALAEQRFIYADATKVPLKESESSLSYCPRCLDDYHAIEASCSNCGGRPTIPYGK